MVDRRLADAEGKRQRAARSPGLLKVRKLVGACGMYRMGPGWQGWIQHRTIRMWASRKRRRAGKCLARSAGPCMVPGEKKEREKLETAPAARNPLQAARVSVPAGGRAPCRQPANPLR